MCRKMQEHLLLNRLQVKKLEQVIIEYISSNKEYSNTYLGGGPNPGAGKDAKKLGGAGRGATVEDPGAFLDDQTIPEAPKMIVFATIPHLQPTRMSSYGETADRSERLRRYNLNDTFSTSMLLTSVRDIPLEPPPSPEFIPSWKLIRPRKAKLLPHAEPMSKYYRLKYKKNIYLFSATHEPKPERWIEIASPYINYPTASALNMYVYREFNLPFISFDIEQLEQKTDDSTSFN
jgi:hypothetical protein